MTLDPVNPLLKEAAEEIKAILKKRDIAGMVLLCSGEQSEYVNWIADPYGPSWTCLRWDDRGIRFKTVDIKRDHAMRYKAQSTAKMIFTMRSLLASMFGFFDGIGNRLKDHWEIGEGEISHVPHREKQ